MIVFGKFLYKTLCLMLISGYFTGLHPALAEGNANLFETDQKLNNYFSNSANAPTMTKTLCPQGQYLARCGSSISLGTNLLKGMQKTTASGTVITTPDYYSYETPVSDVVHIANLREFFEGKESFAYTKQDGSQVYVVPEEYKDYRNQIISHICTDDTGILIGIECKKCPGDSFVAASTVETDSESNKILWRTWNVHTIADCYMEEFSDNTGTYKYIPSNIESTVSSMPCYYSTNVPGDTLR